MDEVCFHLPGHGDAALRSMNSLREQLHFCDITITAGGRQMFRGHKVVLAACSAFLRDQFLLNPSAELQQVSVLHSSTVIRDLLQSCYTGILQFSAKEIVNYLTAASYLQMEHVVEKCRGALSNYLQPRNHNPVGTLKMEDSQSMPVIVSGSAHSLESVSPPSDHTSSLQPHSSEEEALVSGDERPITQQRDDGDLSIQQVRESECSGYIQEEEARNDFTVFQVHVKDDHQDPEDNAGVLEEARETVELLDTQVEELIREEDGAAGSSHRGGPRPLRRRHGEPKGGRGRGFKHRKRYTFRERRPLGNFQQAWRFPTSDEIIGNFAADIGPDYLSAPALADGTLRAEYRAGEGQGTAPGSDCAPAHFSLDTSGAVDEMGVVAVPTEEEAHGDDSVAVVGSTSCVTGTVACEHCGLAFSSVQALAVHSRSTHLLYVCPCCGKHFSHSSNLSRHMAVHRATKLHSCPLCHKTFTQKSTLCDHMNMHSGARPHVCAFCHVCFAHKPALRRHLKEQHGKTTAQNYLEIQRENGGVVTGGGV
ncbi:zinc finger and BTB domain-containing protein 12 isoform X1 [Electrophorus electricus]|uniref:zinc finger and BTB domain-containing protein 12 isoform X1 n=1 Tax=Electrophorus electricus TaxID=8005 RepID=UPI0015D09CD5|nr:zinc finger and BTB domain-containing protein 12 isoform X1 [Electrophorus electricus]